MSKKPSHIGRIASLLTTTALALVTPAFGQTYSGLGQGTNMGTQNGITTFRPSAAVTHTGQQRYTGQTGSAPCTTKRQGPANHVLPPKASEMLHTSDVIVYPCMNGDKKHGVAFHTIMEKHEVNTLVLLDFGKMIGLVSYNLADSSRSSGSRSAWAKFKINEDRRTGMARLSMTPDSARNGDSYALVYGKDSQDVFMLLGATGLRLYRDYKGQAQHLVPGQSYRSYLPIGGYLDLVDMSGGKYSDASVVTIYARPDGKITASMPSYDALTGQPDDVSMTFTMSRHGNPSIIDQAKMNNWAMLRDSHRHGRSHTGPTLSFVPESVGLQHTAGQIMYLSEAIYLHTHNTNDADPAKSPQNTGKFFAQINADMVAMWPDFKQGEEVLVTRADEYIPGMGDTKLVDPKQTQNMSRKTFKDYVIDYLNNVKQAIRRNFSKNDTPMFDNPWAPQPDTAVGPKMLTLGPTTPGTPTATATARPGLTAG